MSVAQPALKLSHTSTSTPRLPSSDHIAISKAPVSEPGTMPIRYSAGSRSSALVLSRASFSRALPSGERCERPRRALPSTAGVQPGRLAHGPDENNGLAGRSEGLARGASAGEGRTRHGSISIACLIAGSALISASAAGGRGAEMPTKAMARVLPSTMPTCMRVMLMFSRPRMPPSAPTTPGRSSWRVNSRRPSSTASTS